MAISLKDLVAAELRKMIGTRNFATVVAAIGSNTAKVKTTNAAQYCINGKMYTKGATDDLWTLSGTAIPASGTGRFLLCLDASGTASVVQGTSTGYVGVSVPDTVCPIAEVKIVMTSGGAFTPGTTALTGGNISAVTYTDLSVIPVEGYGA